MCEFNGEFVGHLFLHCQVTWQTVMDIGFIYLCRARLDSGFLIPVLSSLLGGKNRSRKELKYKLEVFGSNNNVIQWCNRDEKVVAEAIVRATASALLKDFVYFTQKTYFFYFTSSLLQNIHINPTIIHYILYK